MFYAILSHDVDAQLDTIWCDYPMKTDRRQFLNLQKKFYDQHDCHDWPHDLIGFDKSPC